MLLRLHILVAKIATLDIQDVPDGLVGAVAVHVQDVVQGGHSARIAGCACWFPVRLMLAIVCKSENLETKHPRNVSRPGWKSRREVRPNVRPRDPLHPRGPVSCLPVPKYLIQPSVVQIKQRVSRARHPIPHLTPYPGVPARVRLALDAWPRGFKVVHGQTCIDIRLRGPSTNGVIDTAVDTVVGNLVAGAERVSVVGERPVGDASCSAGTVTSKAVHRVENGGAAESSSFELFLPVSSYNNTSVLLQVKRGRRIHDLGGGLAADILCIRTRSAVPSRARTA